MGKDGPGRAGGFELEIMINNVKRLSQALLLATRGVRAIADEQDVSEVYATGLEGLAEILAAEADALWSTWSGEKRERFSLLLGSNFRDSG